MCGIRFVEQIITDVGLVADRWTARRVGGPARGVDARVLIKERLQSGELECNQAITISFTFCHPTT